MIQTPTIFEAAGVQRCPSPPQGADWDPKLQYTEPCNFDDKYVVGWVTIHIRPTRPGRVVFHWERQDNTRAYDGEQYVDHNYLKPVPWPDDVPNDIEDVSDVGPQSFDNVFVIISRCINCGGWSLSWRRTAQTNEIESREW